MHVAVDHRFRTHQPVFAIVGKRLQLAQPYPLFYQVAPGVVGIFLITPLLDAFVFHLIKLAGVEVQAVGRSVVPELFAIHQPPGVAAMQLAVGFIFVFDLATQFVQCRVSSPAGSYSSRRSGAAPIKLLALLVTAHKYYQLLYSYLTTLALPNPSYRFHPLPSNLKNILNLHPGL